MTPLTKTSACLAALALVVAAASCATAQGPATLEEVAAAHDWQNESGAVLAADFETAAIRLFRNKPRANSIAALNVAGYECIYGEGHEDYPEPAAQCTRSFATRACQMDWEVFLTSDPRIPGKVDTASGSFTRDCVGVDRDWPTAMASPIDDQLAPGPTVN